MKTTESGEAGAVWAFDLGKGSIGEAVRQGNRFLHKASLIIPAEFAETRTAAGRRRMWRTRQAHRAREGWLRWVLKEAGIEPLKRRNYDSAGVFKAGEKADPNLEREFPGKDDSKCYTSSLLRIRLLRGEKLEGWQVFKALHSAIQRRGYDPDIPWKTRAAREEDEGEETGTRQRMEDYVKTLKEMSGGNEEVEFPCYFDAWRMGLWNPEKPKELKDRIDCHAQSTRKQVPPRWLVAKEVTALVEQAAGQFPKLAGRANFFLYGPAEKAYASHDAALRKEFGLRMGGENDWQGVLGQKLPRFDNRIIGKCALIPRLNVCKIKSDSKGHFDEGSKLVAEATFLTKLKNMRVWRGGQEEKLTPAEIQALFAEYGKGKFAITGAQWKKICAKWKVHPTIGQMEVEAPRGSGRSRFCRPALDILKRLILSGMTPLEFYGCELKRINGNKNPLKGLVEEDLKFLQRMGETWEGIYVPDQKLEGIVRGAEDKEKAINQLIGSQNDPIVRHRLSLFAERLRELEERHGAPDEVVLEFVREDFMGKKAKLAYMKFIRDRAAERAKARAEAAEAGAGERGAGFKMELLKEQKMMCIYTGEALVPTSLDEYCIDHIVPRAKGGPDAAINYVLTKRATNDAKAERTPYEWMFGKPGWDAYVERVKQCAGSLRHKKANLLVSPEAETLVEKYTALAETAWISKLAQAILDLRFGWKNGSDGVGKKRVRIVSGGLTGKIRRKYGLNRLLNPNAKDEEEAEKKNRDDDRHHALDAMVISFIPGWARDDRKEGFFTFPDGITPEFFQKEIDEVVPVNVCFEKARLAETIYGGRREGDGTKIVQRVELRALALQSIAPGKFKFDLKYARKQAQTIRDGGIRKRVSEFIDAGPAEVEWNKFCDEFHLLGENGERGSAVRFVTVDAGEATEFKDLSKDKTGAYRRGLKSHKGQFVYADPKGKIRVRPIYAFESPFQVRHEIASMSGAQAKGFFKSGDQVILDKGVDHATTPLAAGRYKLNTIKEQGYAVLTNAAGNASKPISLQSLLAAGFRRASL